MTIIRTKSGRAECVVDGGVVKGKLPNGELVRLWPHNGWLMYSTDGASSLYPPPRTAEDYGEDGYKRREEESRELAAAI